MARKATPPLNPTRLIDGTCEKCNKPVIRCLWDGVQGWLCATCAAFWSDKTPEQEGINAK